MTLHGEGCHEWWGITDERQARGIVNMHAECNPPCARRRAAKAFLENLKPATES